MNAMPMTASSGTERILYVGSGPEDSRQGTFGRNSSTAEGLVHHVTVARPPGASCLLLQRQCAGIVGEPAKDYSPSL
jgi:hypothetical protein